MTEKTITPTQVQVIGHYTVPRRHHAEVVDLLHKLGRHTRDEAGNLAFHLLQDMDVSNQIVLHERYESREAFALHRETDHFTTFVLGRLVLLLNSLTEETFDVSPSSRIYEAH